LKWLLDSSKGTKPDSSGVALLGEEEKNENNNGRIRNTQERIKLTPRNNIKSNNVFTGLPTMGPIDHISIPPTRILHK